MFIFSIQWATIQESSRVELSCRVRYKVFATTRPRLNEMENNSHYKSLYKVTLHFRNPFWKQQQSSATLIDKLIIICISIISCY